MSAGIRPMHDEVKQMAEIVPVGPADAAALAPLVAAFRVTLKGCRSCPAQPDVSAACAELNEYLAAGMPVYGARLPEGQWAGYIVLRVEEPTVWVESLYVQPEFRRMGVASALFGIAEEQAALWGETTVFNNVHPNNHGMIAFLRRHGYTVLNLLEIRKPWPGEKLSTAIRVGEEMFDY